MKKAIKSYLFLASTLVATFGAITAFASDGPIAIPSINANDVAVMAAQIEANYEPEVRLPNPISNVVLNDTSTTNTPKSSGLKLSVNKSSGASVISAAAASSPPVYSISLNSSYSDVLTTAVPEKWYVFTVSSATKFTTLLQHAAPTNSNIDIELYRMPTGTSSYSFAAGSYYAGASPEQLSEMAVPGSYLLMVRAIGAVSGGGFSFGSFSSTGADSNEPDDNLWQAKVQAPTASTTGNLDTGSDQDFRKITLASADFINYKIVGGNYQAQLFYSSGASALVLPNNTIGRLNLPAGTYYWGIKSPTGTGGSGVPYTLSAYHNINSVTFNFTSDEGYTGRVNWGAGNYFALRNSAGVSGYAYDSSGAPVPGATLRFTLVGSVGAGQTVVTATTNASGFYSTTITSPSGAGARTFNGACNKYYYDIHTLKVQREFGATVEDLSSITLIDGASQVNQSGSQVLLNDIAYYIYIGC